MTKQNEDVVVLMGRQCSKEILPSLSLTLLHYAATCTDYATAQMQNIVPTVVKYVQRQQFAVVLRQNGAIAGFSIWCWATNAERDEWEKTGIRDNHSDTGPNLLFLRFTAEPDAVMPLVRALQLEFPGQRGVYRRSKQHQFIRMGDIASCAA